MSATNAGERIGEAGAEQLDRDMVRAMIGPHYPSVGGLIN